MSLTTEQSDDAAIRETFPNMEEGVEYVINDYWFYELNGIYEHNYNYALKDKQEYKFSRKGEQIFLNGEHVFNVKEYYEDAVFIISYSLTFRDQSEKEDFNSDRNSWFSKFQICMKCIMHKYNKLGEIDGKKYKLTAL